MFSLRLQETTLDQILKYISVMISFNGLKLEQPPTNMSFINRFRYCLTLFLLLMWFYIAPTYYTTLGLEYKLAEVYGIIVSGSLVFTKVLWFYIKRNEISAVCAHARIVESATGIPARDLKRAAVTNIFFTGTMIFGGGVFLSKIFLDDERRLPESYSTFPGLHPALESPNYETSLCIYVCGLIGVVILCTGYRVLFSSLIEYTAARLRLIGSNLEQLNSPESESLQHPALRSTLAEPLQMKLGSIINRHSDVLVLVDMIQSLYDIVISIEFALIFIALISHLMNFETSDRVFSIRYIMYLLGEILVYCYCGQHLFDANEDLQRSIYACGWEEWANEKILRRAVLMRQRTAQRPLGLTAG